jgi:hypothetical protein
MAPVQHALLDDGGHHRGAGNFRQAMVRRIVQNGLMRGTDGIHQKTVGVGQTGRCLLVKQLAHQVDGDLCGNLALQVSTHAIGNHQHHRLARVGNDLAVLIIGAASDAAFLIQG